MKITLDIIKSFNPCGDGIEKFEKQYPNYKGTLVEALQLQDVSYSDKIWLVCRVLDTKILIQWSIDCAESVVDNYNNAYPNDTRVSDCIEVTKGYLLGTHSLDELSAAWSAAQSARSAAESAAQSASESASESAAQSASESAARSAALSAAWSAAQSARSAAESAAYSEQEDINLSLLITLVDNLEE